MKRREVIKMLIVINLVVLQGTNVVYAEEDMGTYPVNVVQAYQVDNGVEMSEKVIMEEQHVRQKTYVDEGIVCGQEDISEKPEGESKNEYGDQSENQEISEEGDIVIVDLESQSSQEGNKSQTDAHLNGNAVEEVEKDASHISSETGGEELQDTSDDTTAEMLQDASNDTKGKELREERNNTADEEPQDVCKETDGEELQDVWDKTAGEERQDVCNETVGEELQDVWDEAVGEELQDVWNETAGEHLQDISNDTEGDGSQDISSNTDEASPEIAEEPGREKPQETSDGTARQEVLVYDENGKVVGSYRSGKKRMDTIQQLMDQITSDGLYTLHVQGLDPEGNQVVHKYVFSVNKAGTSFRYDEERANVYLEERFAPAIELSNIDEVTILSCMVNGRTVGYEIQGGCLQIDESRITDGKNRITLEVIDGSGNISSMEPWEFYVKKESTKANNIDTNEVKIEKNSFWDKVLACFMRKIIA